jgi:Integrase core domain
MARSSPGGSAPTRPRCCPTAAAASTALPTGSPGPLPTTTGKIERFHKTLRAELLTGRRFDSLAQAQQVLDAWVTDSNYHRPHQPIAMQVPAKRLQPTAAIPVPVPQSRQPITVGPTEITRRVSASGLIGVCYQQVSAAGTSPARSPASGSTPPCSRPSSPAN